MLSVAKTSHDFFFVALSRLAHVLELRLRSSSTTLGRIKCSLIITIFSGANAVRNRPAHQNDDSSSNNT
jgi:hypothetical protein